MDYFWEPLTQSVEEHVLEEGCEEEQTVDFIRQIFNSLPTGIREGLKEKLRKEYQKAKSLKELKSAFIMDGECKILNSLDDRKWIAEVITVPPRALRGLKNEPIYLMLLVHVVTYDSAKIKYFKILYGKVSESIYEHVFAKDNTYGLYKLIRDMASANIISIPDNDVLLKSDGIMAAKYKPSTVFEKQPYLSADEELQCALCSCRVYSWWKSIGKVAYSKEYQRVLETPTIFHNAKQDRQRIKSLEDQNMQLRIEIKQSKEKNSTLGLKVTKLNEQLLRAQRKTGKQQIERSDKTTALEFAEIERLRQRQYDLERQYKMQSSELDKAIRLCRHYQNKLSRPTRFSEIPDWVRITFNNKLILLPCAERMLQKDTICGIDLDILCDAVEYLAEEYRDYRLGELEQDAILDICAYKYERAFKIKNVNTATIQRYNSQYTVKYKNETVPLNLHLCYGNNPETVIRIYFFYDSDTQQIVIGSLPKHLDTGLTN